MTNREAQSQRGDLGRCECGHTKLDPTSGGERHYFGDTASKDTMCLVNGCACRHFKPAERPAEGREDVEAAVEALTAPLPCRDSTSPKMWRAFEAAIVSLIQRERDDMADLWWGKGWRSGYDDGLRDAQLPEPPVVGEGAAAEDIPIRPEDPSDYQLIIEAARNDATRAEYQKNAKWEQQGR